jgi:hypothetical protein
VNFKPESRVKYDYISRSRSPVADHTESSKRGEESLLQCRPGKNTGVFVKLSPAIGRPASRSSSAQTFPKQIADELRVQPPFVRYRSSNPGPWPAPWLFIPIWKVKSLTNCRHFGKTLSNRLGRITEAGVLHALSWRSTRFHSIQEFAVARHINNSSDTDTNSVRSDL